MCSVPVGCAYLTEPNSPRPPLADCACPTAGPNLNYIGLVAHLESAVTNEQPGEHAVSLPRLPWPGIAASALDVYHCPPDALT